MFKFIGKLLWQAFKPYILKEIRRLFFRTSPYQY